MRILVVEDEHKIANSIKKGLEQEAFTVDVAYTGTDGFDLASSESYDVMVLDILLPGINGLDICTKIRSQHIHTPILLLTAKGQVSDRVAGLNSGADDYLPKPFAFEELLARIRALSRRPPQTTGTILSCADLSLNITSFEVIRNHVLINLSGKEYSLLEYLLRHPHQVLTKDQIINHVWSYDSDVLPNTVEVYIGYLRNKIDKPFPDLQPLIHTIRGFGYKLSDD